MFFLNDARSSTCFMPMSVIENHLLFHSTVTKMHLGPATQYQLVLRESILLTTDGICFVLIEVPNSAPISHLIWTLHLKWIQNLIQWATGDFLNINACMIHILSTGLQDFVSALAAFLSCDKVHSLYIHQTTSYKDKNCIVCSRPMKRNSDG